MSEHRYAVQDVTHTPHPTKIGLFLPVISMSPAAQDNKYTDLKVLVISCLAVFLLFVWQGNKGFSLWDEGFLWYGVQRVLLGEIPIIDFMAYDPGRYYWSAAFLSVFADNGIMSLRVAVAVFQALGLFVGLLLISRSTRIRGKFDVLFLLVSVVILVAWMFPRQKLFDISLSIFLVGALTYLVSNPVPKRYIITGICVGLTAVFGRNHGMYGAVGSILAICWLSIKNRSGTGFLKAVTLWGMGVVIGFLPIILMALLIPGFAMAFWESIRSLFEMKATNLPLPVPWPWKVNFAALTARDATRAVAVGLLFIGTLVFGVGSPAWVVYQRLKGVRVQPAMVAAAFMALPYLHYAFSRADVGHLAQSIFPFLLSCLGLLAGSRAWVKWTLATALCATSVWVLMPYNLQCQTGSQCVDVEISGSKLAVDPGTASDISLLRSLAAKYAPDGKTFVAAPVWPGAYALLERKAPVWEIYPVFPRTETFEKREIERIEAARPGFVFIFDLPLDGRDDLRFKDTHPLTYRYILNNFELVPNQGNPAYQIYRARESGQ